MGPLRWEQCGRTWLVEQRSNSQGRIVWKQGQEEEMERVWSGEDERLEPRDDMGGLGAWLGVFDPVLNVFA
jgi:hypothetical protein